MFIVTKLSEKYNKTNTYDRGPMKRHTTASVQLIDVKSVVIISTAEVWAINT